MSTLTNYFVPPPLHSRRPLPRPMSAIRVPERQWRKFQSKRTEVLRLWTASFQNNQDLSAANRAYVAQMMTLTPGLSQADAEKRVNDVITEAKTAADTTRKGAAKLSFWLTAAMLFGALAASLAAVEGGSLRDGIWNDRVLTPRPI